MYRRFVLLLSMLVSTTYADGIYKSIDAEGNVIYSDEPPAHKQAVETLKPPEEASEDELEAARERQKRLKTFLDESADAGGDRVGADGSARRETARRRAMWGKDWPIHEPLRK